MTFWEKLFKPVKTIEPSEAQALLARWPEGSYTLLDVRQPSEYEIAHLPGARLIPLAALPDSLKELDPEKPVLVY